MAKLSVLCCPLLKDNVNCVPQGRQVAPPIPFQTHLLTMCACQQPVLQLAGAVHLLTTQLHGLSRQHEQQHAGSLLLVATLLFILAIVQPEVWISTPDNQA